MTQAISRLILACLLLFSLNASDCNGSGPDAGNIVAEVQIDGSQNGGQVAILRGQILVVTLDSNPTTGFTWEVEEVDTSLLRQMGLPEFQSSSDALGAGGTQTFRFQSLRSGETDLKLSYRRPWEEGTEPLDSFQVRVIVR